MHRSHNSLAHDPIMSPAPLFGPCFAHRYLWARAQRDVRVTPRGIAMATARVVTRTNRAEFVSISVHCRASRRPALPHHVTDGLVDAWALQLTALFVVLERSNFVLYCYLNF